MFVFRWILVVVVVVVRGADCLVVLLVVVVVVVTTAKAVMEAACMQGMVGIAAVRNEGHNRCSERRGIRLWE